MYELADIRSYVEKITYMISIVLEMDVLICDRHLNVLGDYTHQGEVCNPVEMLKPDSVVSTAMNEQQVLVFNNAKKESAGCIKCIRRSSCRTETIIAYPLSYHEEVIGGIGIFSPEKRQKDMLSAKQLPFIEFLKAIGELLISKLEDESKNNELKVANHLMNEIIETMESPIVSLDENKNILYENSRFGQLIPGTKKEKELALKNILKDLKADGDERTISNVYLSNKEYEVTYLPTVVDEKCYGAMLYFNDASQILAKANRLVGTVKVGKFEEIIGKSRSITKVIDEAKQFANSFSNVLIQGESGTGKEVFAAAIHSASKRAAGPFVAVNCAAIPDNLLESELFGYVEGAFTGAIKGGRPGKFEIANHGTLFLDEIGELPIHLQPKLLRALQEKKIVRVGSNRSIDIDIRIIAATNRNLQAMMDTGEFREDLYYRLSVIPIQIPPLRERKEDIPILAEYFLNMYKNMLGKEGIIGFSDSAVACFSAFPWPGNVRELQNSVEYAVNKCTGDMITRDDLPVRIAHGEKGESGVLLPPRYLKDMEKEAIESALLYYEGVPDAKEKAAVAMGISRATMYRKIKEYQIHILTEKEITK